MPRGLLIFALCLPLAVLMGFMLSDPLMGSNMMVISGALFALLIPAALAIHHRALIWSANMVMIIFFLPGQPQLWMLLAGLSFLISTLSRPLAKVRTKPVWDKLVLTSLLLLLCCVGVTAMLTGGIGMRVFGGSMFGGRKYMAIFGAVIGFIALTLLRLPRKTAQRDIGIYALGAITPAMGNIAYSLGPTFYFLFLLFPAGTATMQAAADFSPVLVGIKRYAGLGPASVAVCLFCLLRWGVRGCLDIKKPWRLGWILLALGLGLFSGFRSTILVCFLVSAVQFFAEGLHRTRYLAGVGIGVLAGLVLVAVSAESLPLSAQRALSFLPIKVNAVAAADARASLEWRLDMWRIVAQEIPNHLWFGKGYAIDPTDIFFAEESLRRGFISDFETSMNAGDFHNGPLSIIVPFGVVGCVVFFLFLAASLRVLWRNLRYGDPEIKNINVFLFSYFVGRLIFFLAFYGAMESEVWTFVSAVGISLSLNGGLKNRPQKPRLKAEFRPAREREAELAVI